MMYKYHFFPIDEDETFSENLLNQKMQGVDERAIYQQVQIIRLDKNAKDKNVNKPII